MNYEQSLNEQSVAAVSDTPEINVVGTLSAYDLEFSSLLLEGMVGGEPQLFRTEAEGEEVWVVMPTCECEDCRTFMANYIPTVCETPIRAMRRYAESRAAYFELQETAEQTGTKH